MRPNLRHLEVILEVARRGSVSAAARALYLSQPAATQAIAAMERYFRAPLFERTSNGMTPTAAGALLVARVERALAHVRDGIAEMTRGRPASQHAHRSISSGQLEALVAVVEHRRFGLAARALQVSRPTLHRAAREVEQRVGVQLFERTSFGVQPTREAQRLATRVQLAFAELAQGSAEVGALTGALHGETIIGAMPLARSYLVPRAVLQFTARRPAHTVSILEGPYESLLAALRVGRADVLIGALRNPAPADEVLEELLFNDPLAIIVRAGHPLTRIRGPSVAALARYPWIVPRAGSPLRRQFNELFARAGLPPPASSIECNSLVASRAFLIDSDRVMLLSAHQVQQDLDAGLLACLPHPHGRVVRAIGLTTRRDWRPTDEQLELLESLRHFGSQATRTPSGRRP